MNQRTKQIADLLRWFVVFATSVLIQCPAGGVTLDAFWNGKAHFVQVGIFDWGSSESSVLSEQASWFAVRNGIWYAFNRSTVPGRVSYCPRDHTRVVVRKSTDQGRTWSAPVSAIEPGASPAGDGCAVLDGSSFFDASTNTWHILAQCLDQQNSGGWTLCHYTRKGESPQGRFIADPLNPVVRGGALWSRICAGRGKACPIGTVDEGTPEIFAKQGNRFLITIHGFEPRSTSSFRGVVATSDFHRWQVAGADLPDDATLGPADCRAWLKDCTGVGEGSSVATTKHLYLIVERMNKGLLCTTNQNWEFEMIRTDGTWWPRSGRGEWQKLPGPALLRPSRPSVTTLCAVSYARWLVDGSALYLVYEDWDPGRTRVHRRLLKLVNGGGSAIQIQ